MNIIKWENKNWNEIEDKDNPAFDFIGGDRKKGRSNKSLLVMKVLPYEAKSVGKFGYVVIEVPLRGDVFRRGLFWSYSDACIFTEAYAFADAIIKELDK